MTTDTFFYRTISLMKNKCAQVYTAGRLTFVQPMKYSTGNSIGDSLWNLCNQVGIPDRIIADLAKAQEGVNTKFQAAVRKLRIKLHWYEKGQHQQNYKAEGEINVLK